MRRSLFTLCVHTWYLALDLARQPMYVVTTVLFPSMFFWFFGISNAKSSDELALLTGSFASFAVLGVVLFQFGVGIAQDKESSWYSYLRVLPSPRPVHLIARFFAGLFFGILAVAAVLLTAYIFGTMEWTLYNWGMCLLTLLVGSLPFAALGMSLGLLVSARSALPVLNLIYLPLSFAGGLWLPPHILPKVVQDLSPYLPTRMFGELVWSGLFNKPLEDQSLYGLMAYGFGFISWAVYLIITEEEKLFS